VLARYQQNAADRMGFIGGGSFDQPACFALPAL
jgi:hypothetical protein